VKQFREELIEWVRIKEAMCGEGAAAVEYPLVREHQKPGPEVSLIRIELLDGPKDIEEDLLDRIFGFGITAQDASCNSEQARAMPSEQDCQSIRVSVLQMLDQCFIGQKTMS